ncbi:glycosyltransferase [Candidatus Saccharibacteria bacterium]|nr:glycosyltransferase [Candidatus Saccharibacteria bacterium]
MKKDLKVAIVCDWLTNVGGAEKVLYYIWRLFPEAPIYTSQYDPKGIDWFLKADVRTGSLQKYPAKLRRFLGPLRQRYFSKLDLSEYDLIISVTGAEAKAVKSGKWLHKNKKKALNPRGIHISYCHVPTQYYWQMYDDYIKNPGFGVLNPLVRFFFRLFVIPLRRADLKSAQRPDDFVTISKYAKEQILKYYGRESVIIHPPVELDDFKYKKVKMKDYYITTSRQVNWKRVDLAIKACMMTQRKLLVIGEGPEHKKLVKLAKDSGLVEFLPLMKKKELAKYLAGAKGYIFPSLEPFGIAPVEALAAGCPVLAFSEGGSRDYIIEGKNGLFFKEQTAKSTAEGILEFEKMKFDRAKVSKTAEDFSVKRFEKEIKDYIEKKLK